MSAVAEAPLERRVGRAWVTELRKLGAQAPVRLLVVLAIAGPFAFTAILAAGSGTPSDAVFGADVHSSGYAGALVVLSFAGNWGTPIIAGLVAGDLFSGEDRLGTWKTILTRSCSLGDLFCGKVLAGLVMASGLVALAGAAAIVAGVVFDGGGTLIGLSGQPIGGGEALALTALAWLLSLIPAASFVGIGILFSVASRSGVVGVVGPLVAALATQLLNLIGHGAWLHLLLPGATFFSVFGLFTAPAFAGPLLVTLLAGLGWLALSLGIAWWLLRRRDFLGGGGERPAGWRGPLRAAVGTAVAVAVLALLTDVGPQAVTRPRLQRAVAATFSRASLEQQRELGRIAPPGARLDVAPYCSRHGVASRGPGDWTCNLQVYLPQPRAVPFTRSTVDYDVSVASNGCYKAESPPTFIGGPTMSDGRGRQVLNPLYIVYGCFDVLG